tara:strand:+ start:487 stop:1089 length:603 start_codon:yes stop_codon:yes gene_type:complete
MSGILPTSPAFSSLIVQSVQPTFISRSISGRRQARQTHGQYFKMTATYPPMTRAEFAPINAFITKQRGRYESFSLIPPVLNAGLGSPAGTPLVNGASQTGRTIVTDGWTTADTVVIFKAGDYLKFSNHDKVYTVTEDATSDGSGDETISIEPALITSPADNSAITYTSVPFTVAMTTRVQEFSTGTSGLYEYELDLEEVI